MGYVEFFRRFDFFTDSLIRSMTIEYGERGETTFTITIFAQDDSARDHSWKTVKLTLHGVHSFRLGKQENVCGSLMSNGITVVEDSEMIGLDLGEVEPPPRTKCELTASDCFVLGTHLDFAVTSESPSTSTT